MSRTSERPGNTGGRSADQRPAPEEPAGVAEDPVPVVRSSAPAEDSRFVGRLLVGDEAAFTEMVGRYNGRLLQLALTFVSDRAAAKEVVQDTWLGVLQGLRSFEGRSSLKTWIFRILVNRAKSRGVRDKRLVPFSSLTAAEATPDPAVDPGRFTAAGMWRNPPEAWAEETPEKLLLRAEVRRLIEEAIDRLPPEQRLVLTLRDVEGVESGDICNILDITETNQRVLLHRARSKVRRALERHLRRR